MDLYNILLVSYSIKINEPFLHFDMNLHLNINLFWFIQNAKMIYSAVVTTEVEKPIPRSAISAKDLLH